MTARTFTNSSEAAAYNLAAKGHSPYGPMVCLCETPDADPARDFGMCHRCYRKPLTLMAPPR